MADGGSQSGSGCHGIPRDDGDTIGDQRHTVGTLAPGDVRRTVDAGTSRYQRRPSVERGTRPGVGVWNSIAAGEADAQRTSWVHILREAFDYSYRDIANVLRLEEANARQVVTRARQHVANGRRTPANSTEQRRLLEGFIAAAQNGDIAGLECCARDSSLLFVSTQPPPPPRLTPCALSQLQACRPSRQGDAVLNRINGEERDIDHETRHHRRHRAYRIKAGDQAVQRGHDAVAASPGTGVNTLTGEGLADALQGASVVVDVSNSPSFEDAAVMEFFTTATRNLLMAARAAGVTHYVALSVVGTERLSESGYFRAKTAQEPADQGVVGLPDPIVHATQFFEFVKNIAAAATDGNHCSPCPGADPTHGR